MKIKRIAISIALCFAFVLAGLGLAGCGGVSLTTLKDNFENLDATISAYSQGENSVFKNGTCVGLQTNLLVETYGQFVDDKIKTDSNYAELLELYNTTLVISSDYVNKNRLYILGLDEAKLSKETKNALSALNGSLVAYTKSIKNFVSARKSLIEHFERHAGVDDKADESSLQQFKELYGEMVKKNVALSTNMARMVETTKIFDLLKSTTPTVADTETVKEYIRAKMLPIYSELKITEIANKMNWNAQVEGDCKARIDALISNLDRSFAEYKETFLTKPVKSEALSSEDINKVFDWTDEFFVEAETYFKALAGLNLKKLAVKYDNNMKNYLKINELAEIYLQKLEQFVGFSLSNFVSAVSEKLFQA